MITEPIQLTPEVIQAINEELAYQASLHSRGRADTIDHGVEGQILTLEEYTRETTSRWVRSHGQDEALDSLRKVAAIAARALIRYGCPRRLDDAPMLSAPAIMPSPDELKRKSP